MLAIQLKTIVSPFKVIDGGKDWAIISMYNSLYRVYWTLLFCLFTTVTALPAQSPMIGQCHEYLYTLDQEILCLYNHETDKEQTFCLSPSDAYWDSNGIIAQNTPLYPTKGYYEPAWMVRWVTFYDATDQETGEVYSVILNYECYRGELRRITLIRIMRPQLWE